MPVAISTLLVTVEDCKSPEEMVTASSATLAPIFNVAAVATKFLPAKSAGKKTRSGKTWYERTVVRSSADVVTAVKSSGRVAFKSVNAASRVVRKRVTYWLAQTRCIRW
jgi:hypothetical protein